MKQKGWGSRKDGEAVVIGKQKGKDSRIDGEKEGMGK